MELLVITREFPPYVAGGISHHVQNLYSELSDRGHNIHIISGKIDNKYDGSEIDDRNLSVDWINYPTPKLNHIFFPLLVKRKLLHVDTGNYDAALTHTGIPFNLDLPVIAKFHDMQQADRRFTNTQNSIASRFIDNVINPTRRAVDQASLRHADYLIFNSELNERLWKEYYGLSTPSTVIYNGVDTDIFYPRTRCGDDYILFVGAGERKGTSKVQSFAESSGQKVKIIGDKKASGENIESFGRVNQKPLSKHFSGAKATIHPANFEAFGNVILESLACGTPVVVSSQCGAAELVDETCGRVTDNLTEGVSQVQDIPPEQCVSKAKNYTWGKVAMRTEKAIRSVI